MTRDPQIIKKPKKNGLQPPFQVHHQEGYQNSAFGSACQLAHHPAEPEAAFCLPELAFNRIACHFILINLLPDFSADLRILGRPSQRRSRKPDTMFFAESPVVLIPIYLVCMHRFRPTPKPLAVFFDLSYQIPALVIAVPAKPVHKSVSVDHAHRDLGAKLGGSACFTPLDGPDMGLGDADNTVVDAVALFSNIDFC